MPLDILGAGFGRTGTMSLKLALDELGRGPTYHMVEVFEHPEHIPLWVSAQSGETPWDTIFEGYRAAVDWPAAGYWKPLLARYPDAKVILTTRAPERWYTSVSNTIYPSSRRGAEPDDVPPHVKAQREMASALVWDGVFEGRFHEREFALEVFERWNAEVQATVPSEQLLVFEVKEGWEPLCAFLDEPVPDAPFPRSNSTAEFRRMVGLD